MEINFLNRRIETCILRIRKKDIYGFFLDPIPVHLIPDYLTINPQPMDLGTMMEKAKQNQYTTFNEVLQEFRLIIDNCVRYNPPDTAYYREARKLDEFATPFLTVAHQKYQEEVTERRLRGDFDRPPGVGRGRGRGIGGRGTRGGGRGGSQPSNSLTIGKRSRSVLEEASSSPHRKPSRKTVSVPPTESTLSRAGTNDAVTDGTSTNTNLPTPLWMNTSGRRRLKPLPCDYRPDEDIWHCAVCDDDYVYPGNVLVQCSNGTCSLVVHQKCYGIREVPEGDWLCDPCIFGFNTHSTVCILCTKTGGALKPTDRGILNCEPDITTATSTTSTTSSNNDSLTELSSVSNILSSSSVSSSNISSSTSEVTSVSLLPAPQSTSDTVASTPLIVSSTMVPQITETINIPNVPTDTLQASISSSTTNNTMESSSRVPVVSSTTMVSTYDHNLRSTARSLLPIPPYPPLGYRPSEWAHVLCASYVPEVSIGDVDLVAPITNIAGINPRRARLTCRVCRKSGGAPVQCTRGICGFSVHPSCAREGRLEMGWEEDKKYGGGHYGVHCNKHCDKDDSDISRLPFAERAAIGRARIRLETEAKLTVLRAERDKLAAKFSRFTSRLATAKEKAKAKAIGTVKSTTTASTVASSTAVPSSSSLSSDAMDTGVTNATETTDIVSSTTDDTGNVIDASTAAPADEEIITDTVLYEAMATLSDEAAATNAEYDSASDDDDDNHLPSLGLDDNDDSKATNNSEQDNKSDNEGEQTNDEEEEDGEGTEKTIRSRPKSTKANRTTVPSRSTKEEEEAAEAENTKPIVSMSVSLASTDAIWEAFHPYFLHVTSSRMMERIIQYFPRNENKDILQRIIDTFTTYRHPSFFLSLIQNRSIGVSDKQYISLLDIGLLPVWFNLQSLRDRDSSDNDTSYPPSIPLDKYQRTIEQAITQSIQYSEAIAARGDTGVSPLRVRNQVSGESIVSSFPPAATASFDPTNSVPPHIWIRLLQSMATKNGNMYPSFLTHPSMEVNPLVLESTFYRPEYQSDYYARTFTSADDPEYMAQPMKVTIPRNPDIAIDPYRHSDSLGIRLVATGGLRDHAARISPLPVHSSGLITNETSLIPASPLPIGTVTETLSPSILPSLPFPELGEGPLSIPEVGTHYLDIWAEEDKEINSESGRMNVNNSLTEIGPTSYDAGNTISLQFQGWGDGDDFSKLRQDISAEFTPSMKAVLRTVRAAGLCRDTHFRFAKPEDACLLHVLNRVNDAFASPSDFRNTVRAQNEFILVAVRRVKVSPGISSPARGTTESKDEYEEHIVGFINWYCLWFKGRHPTGYARVMYVATLQAVKPTSHSDVCGILPKSSPAKGTGKLSASKTRSSPSRPGTATESVLTPLPPSKSSSRSTAVKEGEVVPPTKIKTPIDTKTKADNSNVLTPSSSAHVRTLGSGTMLPHTPTGTSVDAAQDADPTVINKTWYPYTTRNPGAEDRTGTILLALALTHGKYAGLSALLVDSTKEAKDYYLRVVGMAPLEQGDSVNHGNVRKRDKDNTHDEDENPDNDDDTNNISDKDSVNDSNDSDNGKSRFRSARKQNKSQSERLATRLTGSRKTKENIKVPVSKLSSKVSTSSNAKGTDNTNHYQPMHLSLTEFDPVALAVPPGRTFTSTIPMDSTTVTDSMEDTITENNLKESSMVIRMNSGLTMNSFPSPALVDECFTELRNTQALFASIAAENSYRIQQLSDRINREIQLRTESDTLFARRMERRILKVFGEEEMRRNKKREDERKRAEDESDAVCTCCGGGDSFLKNAILFCDKPGCNLAVHQACYGIAAVPQGDWYCAPCSAGFQHPSILACVICNIHGGPLRPVANSDGKVPDGRARQWCHPHCARLCSLILAPHIQVHSNGLILGLNDVRSEWNNMSWLQMWNDRLNKYYLPKDNSSGSNTELSIEDVPAPPTVEISAPENSSSIRVKEETVSVSDTVAPIETTTDPDPNTGTAVTVPSEPSVNNETITSLTTVSPSKLTTLVSTPSRTGTIEITTSPSRSTLNTNPPVINLGYMGNHPCCVCGSSQGILLSCCVTGCKGLIHPLCSIECGLVSGSEPVIHPEADPSTAFIADFSLPLHPVALANALTKVTVIDGEDNQTLLRSQQTGDGQDFVPTPEHLYVYCASHRIAFPGRLQEGAQEMNDEWQEKGLIDGKNNEESNQTTGKNKKRKDAKQSRTEEKEENSINVVTTESRNIRKEYRRLAEIIKANNEALGPTYIPSRKVYEMLDTYVIAIDGNESKEDNQRNLLLDENGENDKGTQAILALPPPPSQSVPVKDEETGQQTMEDRCTICGIHDGEAGNDIVYCDRCGLAVHQECYGVPVIPSGNWYCTPCSYGLNPADLACSLCVAMGGALKPTEEGIVPHSPRSKQPPTEWAHVTCALFIPEVSFSDDTNKRSVCGIPNISPKRRNLRCMVCRQKVGAPIQCKERKCIAAFHVTCGMASGYYFGFEEENDEIDRVSYCPKHVHLKKQSDDCIPACCSFSSWNAEKLPPVDNNNGNTGSSNTSTTTTTNNIEVTVPKDNGGNVTVRTEANEPMVDPSVPNDPDTAVVPRVPNKVRPRITLRNRDLPAVVVPYPSPVDAPSLEKFVPLNRVLVTLYGYLINIDSINSSRKVCNRILPPFVRRKQRRLLDAIEDNEDEEDAEDARNQLQAVQRLLFGKNFYLSNDSYYVLGLRKLTKLRVETTTIPGAGPIKPPPPPPQEESDSESEEENDGAASRRLQKKKKNDERLRVLREAEEREKKRLDELNAEIEALEQGLVSKMVIPLSPSQRPSTIFANVLDGIANSTVYDNAIDADRKKKVRRKMEPGSPTPTMDSQDSLTLYCLCQRPAYDDDMIGCDNGSECPHGEWFHFRCVGLQGAPNDETWFCPGCRKDKGESMVPETLGEPKEGNNVNVETTSSSSEIVQDDTDI